MDTKALEIRFTSLDKRVDSLEGTLKAGFGRLETKMETVFDDFAVSIKQEFDRVEEKFDARFDQVDKRFEQIDVRFDQMDRRFDRIENVSIGNHDRRIENLEDSVRQVKTKIGLK